jgi:uncharacterized membrane protein
MRMSNASRVIAIVCTGLYAGIIFGDRMGATYARPALSAPDFVLFQQIEHLHLRPLLLPLIAASVLAGLIWVWSMRTRWRTPEFWLAAVSTAAMIVVAALTRIVNFPIDDALMTWNAAAPPANARNLWVPWEHVHTIRAALSVAAFALQVLALNSGVQDHNTSSH